MFGYTPLESEEAILQKVIDTNSTQKEGFLISKSYQDLPYAKGFYTPSGRFEFLESFDEEPLMDEGFYLISAKQNRSLNSQFVTDDYHTTKQIYPYNRGKKEVTIDPLIVTINI